MLSIYKNQDLSLYSKMHKASLLNALSVRDNVQQLQNVKMIIY